LDTATPRHGGPLHLCGAPPPTYQFLLRTSPPTAYAYATTLPNYATTPAATRLRLPRTTPPHTHWTRSTLPPARRRTRAAWPRTFHTSGGAPCPATATRRALRPTGRRLRGGTPAVGWTPRHITMAVEQDTFTLRGLRLLRANKWADVHGAFLHARTAFKIARHSLFSPGYCIGARSTALRRETLRAHAPYTHLTRNTNSAPADTAVRCPPMRATALRPFCLPPRAPGTLLLPDDSSPLRGYYCHYRILRLPLTRTFYRDGPLRCGLILRPHLPFGLPHRTHLHYNLSAAPRAYFTHKRCVHAHTTTNDVERRICSVKTAEPLRGRFRWLWDAFGFAVLGSVTAVRRAERAATAVAYSAACLATSLYFHRTVRFILLAVRRV